MSNAGKVPEDLRYTETHEWVRLEGQRATVGITDHAQGELTDVVFVDLPPVGKEGKAKSAIMLLESVKTVADIYAPFDGKIVEVNSELKQHPELVNKDPYGKGWLYRLEVSGPADPGRLLDAAGYRRHLESSP
jgi:glycine cleavage system H protein